MLVLTRKPNQSIIINAGSPDQVILTVMASDKREVKLGLTAPIHVSIDREEVAVQKAKNSTRHSDQLPLPELP